MIPSLARRAFGSRADRRLARYARTASAIIDAAPRLKTLSAEQLLAEAASLREQAKAGTLLDGLIVPAFALVREAARRTLGEEHVPAQLIGGLALHDGKLVEMKTGEGKTLAATSAAFLNALTGGGVHIATPNDHLAGRDAAWMRPVYAALGSSVGAIAHDMDDDARRQAYAADITYGTASEFGFDYLRDNMKFDAADTVQRGLCFALVDEADAVMIDEARVPLSLFGPLGDQSALYQAIDRIVAPLRPEHYDLETGKRRVSLSSTGIDIVETALHDIGLLKPRTNLFDVAAISLLHHVTQSLRAHVLLKRDRDYVVHDDAVVIVDGLTGRLMPGRRYDDGLHQALEAKEGQPIGEESRILASITFQTFLRSYDKLAGMTGTATQDAHEYREIYGLDTLSVPPHRPVVRIDETHYHASGSDKIAAVLRTIEDAKARQQPVLVGTPSVERSEAFAEQLTSRGWRQHDVGNDGDLPRTDDGSVAGKVFTVLNARYHAREAEIIAMAGLPGAVTIATAMAGRGTDIRLGGGALDEMQKARVAAAGGLLVIGTEHHDHARLDDQLRGRAGRQGDPGRSSFHASPDDQLVREQRDKLHAASAGNTPVGPDQTERLVSLAQSRHAATSLEQRLALSRFDQVIDLQRRLLYDRRLSIRDEPDPLTLTDRLREETIDDLMATFAPARGPWDVARLDAAIRAILTLAVAVSDFSDRSMLRAHISDLASQWMNGKTAAAGRHAIGDVLRRIMLALIDQLWAEQSERLEHLKRMIGDRRLPAHKVLTEFRIEAFASFDLMLRDYRHEVTAHAMRLGLERRD
jgi:preprotein translocase subunit SecA